MNTTVKITLAVLAGTLCLLGAAFWNGFPIVYSDTSTYIVSGFEMIPPFDRPLTYGLWLRATSLSGVSLWGVVFCQALVVSSLVLMLVKLVAGGRPFIGWGLLIIAILSCCTGLSWTVGQLMPDIFTPVAFLSLILILFGSWSQRVRVGLYVLFVIAVAMHISHVILFAVIIVAIFVLRRFLLPQDRYPHTLSRLLVMFVLTASAYATMGAAVSKSKHAFVMGTMVENGMLKEFLDEHCATRAYALCAYRDSLPGKAWQFIWNENSPFYKLGGFKGTKDEFNEIIGETFTTPRYMLKHIACSVRATWDQLFMFAIGDGNGIFPEGTSLHERVSLYFGHELPAYTASRQQQEGFYGNILLERYNIFLSVVVLLSAFSMIVILIFSRSTLTSPGLPLTIGMVLLGGILINAWDCGTFANAIDRLGCKMIWLLVLAVLLQGRQRPVSGEE